MKNIKSEGLSDGTTVCLRPLTSADVDASHGFFVGLSLEDRRYLRSDVADRQFVEQRLASVATGDVYLLGAIVGDEIVGHGALELSGHRWRRHMGEIRVLVHKRYRRLGLGALMIRELFRHAEHLEVEKVVVKMAVPQVGARKICERLGFTTDAVLPGYARDASGDLHDVIVMSCALGQFWQGMHDFYKRDDWPDG